MLAEEAQTRTQTVLVSGKGRIVIPAAFRKAMGLERGDALTARMDAAGIHLQSREQALARLRAAVRKHVGVGRSLADELIAERKREAARE